MKSLANDPDFKLEMDFRPGDIQFVNNLAVLHSRTEYEDWPELPRRRHLLRLWLAVPDGWPMPEPLQARHGMDAATGRPRGVNLEPGARLSAPLAACSADVANFETFLNAEVSAAWISRGERAS